MSSTATATNGKIATVTGRETVRIEDVTPKKAQGWLEGNVDNRSLREARVLNLAQALQRNEWELTGDAIVFDEDGNLINGQHRLSAIVVAGIPARLIILRGVPAKAQEVMDQGLSRTLSDQLQRRGVSYYTIIAGACFWLHRLENNERTGIAHYGEPATRPTFRQLLKIYDANTELEEEAPKVNRLVYQLKVRGGATLALYHRLHKLEDPDTDIHAEVDLFFDKWATGADMRVTDPIFRLREWCVEDTAKRHTKGRAPDYRFVAYVLTAWNKWRDNEAVRTLKWAYTPTTKMPWPIPH